MLVHLQDNIKQYTVRVLFKKTTVCLKRKKSATIIKREEIFLPDFFKFLTDIRGQEEIIYPHPPHSKKKSRSKGKSPLVDIK